jgi:hypothetical protein
MFNESDGHVSEHGKPMGGGDAEFSTAETVTHGKFSCLGF